MARKGRRSFNKITAQAMVPRHMRYKPSKREVIEASGHGSDEYDDGTPEGSEQYEDGDEGYDEGGYEDEYDDDGYDDEEGETEYTEESGSYDSRDRGRGRSRNRSPPRARSPPHRSRRSHQFTPPTSDDYGTEEDDGFGNDPDAHVRYIARCVRAIRRGDRSAQEYNLTLDSLDRIDTFIRDPAQARLVARLCRDSEKEREGRLGGEAVINLMGTTGGWVGTGCTYMRNQGKTAPAIFPDDGELLKQHLREDSQTMEAAREVGSMFSGLNSPWAVLTVAMIAGLNQVHTTNVSSGRLEDEHRYHAAIQQHAEQGQRPTHAQPGYGQQGYSQGPPGYQPSVPPQTVVNGGATDETYITQPEMTF